MNLKLLFTIYGIYNILLGLVFVFVPGPAMQGASITTTPDLSVTHQIWGVALIGIGSIAFKLREAEGNKALIGVAKAFIIVTALSIVITIYHFSLGYSGNGMYANTLINGLMLVGLFMKAK